MITKAMIGIMQNLTLRSNLARGGKYLLAFIPLSFAAFAYAGVVARIKPQSIVVCPGKRVTWECIAQADCDCPRSQFIVAIAPKPGEGPGDAGEVDPSPVPPKPPAPGDPPPEDPNDPPYPYPPTPPRPPSPPGNPGKPWPPGYPPGDPEPGCENPPAVSRLTYTWKIERQEEGRWVIERGPEEGGARWSEGGFLFTEAHAGKRFRISCTVKAYGRLPDGTEISCGETTAYAFARVRRADELAVSLEAEPEPAGVWQTIMMRAKVDLECGGTPPFTYRWRFGDDSNKVVVRPDRGESDNARVRNSDIEAYWWNYWSASPLAFQANTLHKLLATARLGWMETWDIAAVTTLSTSVRLRSSYEDHARRGFVWSMETNPCTNERVALLRGGTTDGPARLVAAEVTVDHLWRLSRDRYQMQVVTSHRRLTQVGIVQSVEQFTKGYFDYGAGGQLWYYLAYEPSLQYWFSVQENNLGSIVQALDGGTIHPELYQAFQRNGYTLSGNARVRVVNSGQEWDIFDGQNVFRLRLELEGERQVLKVYRVLVQDWYAEPPLLDTICCRNRDGSPRPPITHAWYASFGGEYTFEYPRNSRIYYKSCRPLTDGWVLKIGYRDSPAFGVPTQLYDQISRYQRRTPRLHFYSAIAVRTFFFPFSYVPVYQLPTWSISFNGEALSWDPLTYPQGTWDGTGAQLGGGNTMQQPETAFGPYNAKIQSDVRR